MEKKDLLKLLQAQKRHDFFKGIEENSKSFVYHSKQIGRIWTAVGKAFTTAGNVMDTKEGKDAINKMLKKYHKATIELVEYVTKDHFEEIKEILLLIADYQMEEYELECEDEREASESKPGGPPTPA